MSNDNTEQGDIAKTAFVNAIKQYNQEQIASARQQAAQMNAAAREQAAQMLQHAHEAARAKVNHGRFEQIFFLHEGHIHAVNPDGTITDLQTSDYQDLYFSCLAFDFTSSQKILFAGTAVAPFSIYKIDLHADLSMASAVSLVSLQTAPLSIDYDVSSNQVYYLKPDGGIYKLKVYPPQIYLPMVDDQPLPNGVEKIGNPVQVPDSVFGKAMSFNGTDQYLTIHSEMFGENVNTFTIEVCVWFTSYGVFNDFGCNSMFFSMGEPNSTQFAQLFYQVQIDPTGGPNVYQLLFYTQELNLSPNFLPNLPQWYHIAVISDGNKIVVYIDGNPKDTQKGSVTIPFGANNRQENTLGRSKSSIAESYPHDYFNGRMAHFRFYNTALDADTIAEHATIVETGTFPGYQFNGKLAAMRLWNVARTQEQIVDDMKEFYYPSALKTCTDKGKVVPVCRMPASRSLALLSKDIEAYDDMLENLHQRELAQQRSEADIHNAHAKAQQKKQNMLDKANANLAAAKKRLHH